MADGKKTPSRTARPNKASALTAKQRTAIVNALAGRANLVRKVAGVQFGGARDIYATAGYVPQGQVKFEHYYGLYTRGDVAGRIVDMPAKTTWRTPPELTEPKAEAMRVAVDADGKTEFVRAFEALAKRLRVWQYFTRADRLAGIGRYSVLLLGVKNTTDEMLKTPLVTVTGPADILYLSVYHEANAVIKEWETDVSNPRFGLPRLYELRISNAGDNVSSGFNTQKLLVHASRVLHIAEDLTEDDVFGRPRLERALNRLFDLDKVAASTGEAYWQMVARILQAHIDDDAQIDDAALKELDEKLLEMVHSLRRQFTGQGVKLDWLSSDTPNVQQVADFYFSLIAGASGIPKRILFGSEMGTLASETDQATYLGSINERQEQFAEPMILRAFVDRMITIKALPAPQTGEYNVVWPTLYEESDLQKAEASLKRAQAAAALTPVGGNPRELVIIDDDSNVWLKPRAADEEVEPLPDDTDDLLDDDLPADTERDGGEGGDGGGAVDDDDSASDAADDLPGVQPAGVE